MEPGVSDHSFHSASSVCSAAQSDPSEINSKHLLSISIVNKRRNKKRNPQILDKLFFRELRGNFASHPHSENLQLFCEIPSRCKIRLRSVLPDSAVDSNHVFLGLSRCGQFLLSYTYTTELDVMTLNEVYKYRLHWWAFVPHQKVRKVSEVLLFGNQGVYSTLLIAVCQWPMDYSRVLIYGNCQESYGQLTGTWNTSTPERSYLTITTVPSLNKCQDCLRVAASYGEEDLAASWDSCLRFSCLKHGLTVHTSFDVVSPFPKFEPSICLKREGTVIFNTGNFLHVLRAELEHLSNGTSAGKTFTTNGVLNSDSSETIDHNHSNVASASSGSNTSSKQDIPMNEKGNEGNIKLNCVDHDVADSQSSPASKTCDIRFHRKPVTIQKSSWLDHSTSHEIIDSAPASKLEASKIGSGCKSSTNTTSENETYLFKSKGTRVVLQVDFGEDDNFGPGDVLNSCGKKISEHDIQSLIVSKHGVIPTKLVSDENFCRLSVENRIFNTDVITNSGEMCASDNKASVHSKTVMKVSGICTEIDSNKNSKLESKSGHYIKDTELLSTREKGKDTRDGTFNARITRSLVSRVGNHIEIGELSVMNDAEIIKNRDILPVADSSRLISDEGDFSNREGRVMDSTQELSITCGSVNGISSEDMVSVVTFMSPITGAILMINKSEDPENGESPTNYDRRKETVMPSSSRSRRIRCSTTVKISNPFHTFHNSGASNTHNKLAEAEKAYEFTDDAMEPGCEKLSSFRRRRLADKKYEFCEEGEDAENIVPFRLTRRRELHTRLRSPPLYISPSPLMVSHRRRHHETLSDSPELVISRPRSPQIFVSDIHAVTQTANHLESGKVVLRPLNCNTATTLLSPRDRDVTTDWIKTVSSNTTVTTGTAATTNNSSNKKKLTMPELMEHYMSDNIAAQSEILVPPPSIGRTPRKEISNSSSINNGNNTSRCTVQLKRRYIEVDDEMVSVITDIEDDDFSESTGYHCALPVEVHGAGYVQLQMISNSKAGKLMAPCVLVHQRSFDIEQFCHEIAERLCLEAGKKYWFCNDYDVEIVDVCPFSGDVIAIALMRIQATIKTKGLAKSQRHPVSSMERQQYQGSCKFVWNVDTGDYAVVWTKALHKVDPNDSIEMDPWNPARDLATKLRENITQVPMCQSVKTISNELVLRGISLVKISDLENLTELTL